jgi:glutamine amidotransferase
MSQRVVILDYGMGNLRSVEKALEHLGAEAVISNDPTVADAAPAVILPGVGAFGDAIAGLKASGLWDVTKARAEEAKAGGRAFLGICLGMQILMESSEESPGIQGLGCFAGGCKLMKPTGLKVPQMGWNALSFSPTNRCPLYAGLQNPAYVYFVHSFEVVPEDSGILSATTEYGKPVAASLHQGNLSATQFHPEKSQTVGLAMLRNFLALQSASV